MAFRYFLTLVIFQIAVADSLNLTELDSEMSNLNDTQDFSTLETSLNVTVTTVNSTDMDIFTAESLEDVNDSSPAPNTTENNSENQTQDDVGVGSQLYEPESLNNETAVDDVVEVTTKTSIASSVLPFVMLTILSMLVASFSSGLNLWL